MDNRILQNLLSYGLDIRDIGFKIQMCGFILADKDKKYLVSFPNEDEYEAKELVAIAPDSEEYKAIVWQMDMQEIELIDNNTNKKIVVRKSQRNLDQQIIWKVFARDNYTCRYCGITSVPMTYDHIKLWEENGEVSEQNGLCTCRKCNKTRGNMDYTEWIDSEYYQARVENLSREVRMANKAIIKTYKFFPDKVSKRKR